MHSFAILSLLASLTLGASAQASVGSFEYFANPQCNPADGGSGNDQTNPANVCDFLPGSGLRLSYVQSGCRFNVYTSETNCEANTVAATLTVNPNACVPVSQYPAFKIVCP